MMADAITAEAITDAEKSIKYTKLEDEYQATVRHLKNGVALLNDTYKVPANPHMAAVTAERDGHQAGWSECLDALADQLHALATQEKSR